MPKLQYFGHLMQRTDSLERTPMLRKIEGRRRRGWERMRYLDGITDSRDMSLRISGNWWWTGKTGVLQSMGSQRVTQDWATERNWHFPMKYLQTPCNSPRCHLVGFCCKWTTVSLEMGLRILSLKGQLNCSIQFGIEWKKQIATHSSILVWRIPVDRGAWRATVHGVTKSWTRLSD